jgi:hypothetical protein
VSVERSTYVLCASLTFLLLFWQWRPMPAVIWHVQEPEMAMVIATLSFIGWVIVFTSSFLIDHFEPFGLHQVASNLVGPEMPAPVFRTPFYYRFCPAPDLSRFHHRVLGDPDHERRASAVRNGDHPPTSSSASCSKSAISSAWFGDGYRSTFDAVPAN